MPDRTLQEQADNHEVIAKSKKVVAFTKGALIAMFAFSFITTTAFILVLMANQERSTRLLLDCTLPTGVCYKEKAENLNKQQEALVGSAVEYCASVNRDSVETIRSCVEAQLRSRP